MIHIKFNKKRKNMLINSDKGIFFCGFFFYEDILYNENNIEEFISQVNLTSNDYNILKSMNGNFLLVLRNEKEVIACVDKIRSLSLFYGLKDGEAYISDDAYWVKDMVQDKYIEKEAAIEFLNTGYVTGKNTLYPNVFQLQAGEVLIVKGDSAETFRYYEYLCNDICLESIDLSIEEMDKVYLNVFNRFIKTLNGRTVILPLSGGYDSRLIAIMLRRLNYNKVITFTYGKPNNSEAIVSKKIAEQLGFKWVFIEYTNKKWEDIYNNNLRKEYDKYADGCSTVAHLQDFLAVLELKEKEMIPDDSIFVPGHGGDICAGGHPPKNISTIKPNINNFEKIIINKHYNLQGKKKINKQQKKIFRKRIKSSLDNLNIRDTNDLANYIGYWGWQERQAKFINNSVRVYEFFGFEFRMPLWDDVILDYFSKIPLEFKIDKKLYKQYIDYIGKNFIETKNINFKERSTKLITNIIKSSNFIMRILYFVKKQFYENEYHGHFLSWYGIMEVNEFEKLYTGISWNCHYYYRVLEKLDENGWECKY